MIERLGSDYKVMKGAVTPDHEMKRKRHEVSLSRPFLHADPLLLSLLALRYSLCPLLYLHSWPKAGAAPYSRVPRNERSKRQGIGWKKRPPPFLPFTGLRPRLRREREPERNDERKE